MSKRKFDGNISGKGYYIALILCAVAIGITGYLYYRNADDTPSQMKDPNPGIQDVGQNGDKDVAAVATQPGETGNEATKPTTGNQSTKPSGTDKKPLQTAAPVQGETITGYAMDCLSYNQTTRDWRTHNGIDISAEAGTQVCAAAEGTVYSVHEDETMGTTVVISHADGYTTRYASLDQEVLVSPGDTVELGQAIGCVGSTALLESALGEHVHFSVSCSGESVDPAAFLSAE